MSVGMFVFTIDLNKPCKLHVLFVPSKKETPSAGHISVLW